MKKFIPLLVIIVWLTGCNKTTQPKWTVYYETTCKPYWVDEDSDHKTKKELTTFLKENNIIPLKIKIEGDRVPTCQYCDCSTGKAYYVQVDKSQLELIGYFGFRRD